VLAYAGPTPPKGNHRYVLIAMEQAGGATLQIGAPEARGQWSARSFAKAHNLKVVGATFFMSQR
jgi:phosphatidylethanolamine-binding protein (PEBP) family uncharacterized protein